MDSGQYKKLKFHDILTLENGELYLILKPVGEKKIFRPIRISLDQVRVIRGILGKINIRDDIYYISKKKDVFKEMISVNIIDDNRAVIKNNSGNTQVNIIDGIILALDNKVPIYARKNILFLNGLSDFFYDYLDDSDIFGSDILM